MTNIYFVTSYIFFDFIPHLIIPFVLGILLIGFVIRFAKGGLNI